MRNDSINTFSDFLTSFNGYRKKRKIVKDEKKLHGANEDNRYIATNGLTTVNVGTDNICPVTIINFEQNIYWQY